MRPHTGLLPHITRSTFLGLLVAALAFGFTGLTGCGAKVAKPLPGKEFNRFFPKDEAEHNVIFTQEKEGFAQAVVKKGGVEVAVLTISDVLSNPDAVAKFATPTGEISGHPMAASGSRGTSILVAKRFQVTVRSSADTFTEADRKLWIGKFDLGKLVSLAP